MKAKLRLIISLAIFALSLLAISQLEIISNMEEMLPKDSPSLLASTEFNKYFDGQDQVLVVVKQKGGTAGSEFEAAAKQYLSVLADELEDKEYIDSIMYMVDTDEMMPFAWAYADKKIYDDIDTAMQNGDLIAIQTTLQDIERQMDAQEDTAEYLVNDDKTHYMMIIKPRLDNTDFLGSRQSFYDGVNSTVDQLLSEDRFAALDSGLTGGAFIQDIESDAVAFEGLFGTMAVTLVLILLVLILFFRSLKLPLLSIYPLVLGAVMAAAAAYIIYGSLNMFAVSFALLLLGLGIDFAVHLLTRYQEERAKGIDKKEAVDISSKSTGSSIIFGAVTTALAFASFAFAKFRAFEQMGVVSAIGLVCLCGGMLILVPAIIIIFDKKSNEKSAKSIRLGWLKSTSEFMIKRPWIVFIIMIAVLGGLFINVKGTTIQSDMAAIYPDNIHSLYWADEVKKSFNYNTDTISIYGESQDELQEITERLSQRGDIEQIDSIFDYMPEDMEYKLDIITRLDAMLQQMGMDVFGEFTLEEMTTDDLPESIKSNYLGKDGRVRAEIVPAVNMYARDEYEPLIDAIYEASGRYPVGMPTVFNEITELVKEDIIKISIFCFAIVLIISIVLFRKIMLALLTVTPLVMTLYTTLGLLPILNIEINVFSIAAFPLIIGIGIDSSIHLIHRLNEKS
ncbi:MAG: MMPL family transporter, partial [Eubacteriales bacterium]